MEHNGEVPEEMLRLQALGSGAAAPDLAGCDPPQRPQSATMRSLNPDAAAARQERTEVSISFAALTPRPPRTGGAVERKGGNVPGAAKVESVAAAIGHSADVQDLLGKAPVENLAQRASVLYSCRFPSTDDDDAGDVAESLQPPTPEQSGGKRARTFPFELDPFQEAAIGCVHKNESVLVSAHTSAGKTVVAQYAISQVVIPRSARPASARILPVEVRILRGGSEGSPMGLSAPSPRRCGCSIPMRRQRTESGIHLVRSTHATPPLRRRCSSTLWMCVVESSAFKKMCFQGW